MVAELDRGGREKDRRFRVVAEKPHRLVRVSMLVADVVSFIDDHEVEARRWVEVQKPFSASSLPAALGTIEKCLVKQRIGKNRLLVSLGPLAV